MILKRRTKKKQARRWYEQHRRGDKRVHGCHLRWQWMAKRAEVAAISWVIPAGNVFAGSLERGLKKGSESG